MKKFLIEICAATLLMTGCGGSGSVEEKPVELHVSAAASLTNVMNELAEVYAKDNPNERIEIRTVEMFWNQTLEILRRLK